MLGLLQSALKVLSALGVIFEKCQKLYYEKKYGKIHDILNEVEDKRVDGILTDADIIAANKRLREQKKGLFP